MILSQVTFNPEITLGTLCMIVAIIGSAITIWTKLNQDVSGVKNDVKSTKEMVDDINEWRHDYTKLIRKLETNVTILTTIAKSHSKIEFEEENPI